MKTALLFWALLSVGTASAQFQLSGTFTGTSDTLRVYVIRQSVPRSQADLPEQYRLPAHRFRLDLRLTEPANLFIATDREPLPLYFMEPGETLHLTATGTPLQETIRAEGTAAAKFRYLLDAQRADRSPTGWRAMNHAIEKLTAPQLVAWFDSVKTAEVARFRREGASFSPVFRRVYESEIMARWGHHLLNRLPWGSEALAQGVPLIRLNAAFRVPETDTLRFGLRYAEMLQSLLGYQFGALFYTVNGRYPTTDATSLYAFMKAAVPNVSLREQVLALQLDQALTFKALSDEFFRNWTDFQAEFPKSAMREYLDARVERMKWMRPGTPAPNFTLRDTTGRAVSLSDFRGKIVLLDFWGSWCGPCRAEMPFAKTVKQHFKNRPDIVFLYVANDSPEAWKKGIRDLGIEGTHVLATKTVEKQYDITAWPTYVLLGRKGEILSTNPARPSADAGQRLIDELEKAAGQ